MGRQVGGGRYTHKASVYLFSKLTTKLPLSPSSLRATLSTRQKLKPELLYAALLSWVIEFELCVSSYIKIWTDQQQLQVTNDLLSDFVQIYGFCCCWIVATFGSWKCIFLFVVLNRQNYNLLMIKIRSNKVPQRGNCHVTAEWANVYHNRKQKQIRKTRLIKLWKHKQNRKQLQYILIHTPIAPVSMFMLLH